MATWTVAVDILYSRKGENQTLGYTRQPYGCFRGPYSYRFGWNGTFLYLVHGDGEAPIGGGWGDFDLKGFNVRQIRKCEEEYEPYDCINGACIKSSKYDTPGLYENISECEKACGTGCSGKCLSNEEWNKIKNLAKQIKDKNCK